CTTGYVMTLDQNSNLEFSHNNGSQSPPVFWAVGSTNAPPEHGGRYIDINGDGKADEVVGCQDLGTPPTNPSGISLNTFASSTGIGWSATSTVGTIPTFGLNNGTGILTTGLFGDLNGDGLPDYTTSLPSYISAASYIGNGAGWDATTTIFAPAKS